MTALRSVEQHPAAAMPAAPAPLSTVVPAPAPAVARQGPSRVILVRPHSFSPNPWTAADNAFQSLPEQERTPVAQRAFEEATALAETLKSLGVGVTVFEDPTEETPDSVFPNNWFTTHDDGTVVLCPMYAPNRRAERREDILAHLRDSGRLHRVVDYTPVEDHGEYLEGTGAMVLDHLHRIAYACRSHRVSPRLFHEFCEEVGYTPVLFDAVDAAGVPVYHTNVLMAVGTRTAVIGAEMIPDPAQRDMVLDLLRSTGRTVVEITEEQVHRFAGNCLEVSGVDGAHLIMSRTALDSLTPEQRDVLGEHTSLHGVDVSTIESAGGSVRCMIAGDHLPNP